MKNKIIIIAFTNLLLPVLIKGQTVNTDPQREKEFAYEVKVIDEFFERFNDNPNTLLRRYITKTAPNLAFGRKEMINTLFNRPESWGGNLAAKSFLRQVMDAAHPQGLRFNDSNWFAEAICVFDVDGRNTEIPLILQIIPGEQQGIRWVIAGVGDSYIFRNEPGKGPAPKAGKKSAAQSLSPSEYATNFLALHEVFRPGMEEIRYFAPQLLKTERGQQFINLIKKGVLSFSYTGLTRFHIYQIPGYELLVERFVRHGLNSGWLITDVQGLPETEVAARKSKLLQRTL